MNEMPLASYLEVLRPKLLIPAIVSTCIGFAISIDVNIIRTLPYLFLAILITGPLIAGGAVVLNQYFDYENDIASERKDNYVLVKGEMSKKVALIYATCLLIAGAFLSACINLSVFAIALIAIALSISYSSPPIRLKGRFLLDSVTNGVCYGVLPMLIGSSINTGLTLKEVVFCIPLFLGYAAGHMLLAIPDIKDDRKAKLRATAAVLGHRNTVLLAMCLFLVMFALTGYYVFLGILPLEIVIIFPIGAYVLMIHVKLLDGGEKILKDSYTKLSLAFLLIAILFLCTLLISKRL